MGAETGSREPSPDGLGPPGFDPERGVGWWHYDEIKERLSTFYPGPRRSHDYEAGYRAALDEVLCGLTPETFFDDEAAGE